MRSPTVEEADSFAVMLHVGVPPRDAIMYFATESEVADPTLLVELKDAFISSRLVALAVSKLQGGEWEKLPLEQRIQVALDKNYAEKAYFLYANNFNEVSGSEYTKLQEARKVLEAKMAGTSGKMDSLQQFFDDVKTGRVKLGVQPPATPEVIN